VNVAENLRFVEKGKATMPTKKRNKRKQVVCERVKKQKTKDPETKRTVFSKNYEKQRLRVARKHQQIATIRRDSQHKFTTELARTCGAGVRPQREG
jgi:hypothetical protein